MRGAPHPPQLEYPWEATAGGLVLTPVRNLPLADEFGDAERSPGPLLEAFAQVLLERFDAVFP
jgi:hypothetical protein